MNAMRERAEQICRAELERALAEGPLDPERLEAATRRLVERMVAAHADVLQRGADGSTP
jgi:glutamyl-tRNA reductase